MSTSIRDQLLKAGLVSEQQVKAAEKQLRKGQRSPSKAAAEAQKAKAAREARAQKLARDRELNRRRAEKAEARARAAQIRDLIDQHRLPSSESDDAEPFYFQDGAHIKRVYVDSEQRQKLTDGALAIVRYRRGFALVPPVAAEKVRERDPQAVIDLDAATSSTPDAQDDAYKGFEVPDDLIW